MMKTQMDYKKLREFSKKEQELITDIYNDGVWNIMLNEKGNERCLSESSWSDVKWEFKQMFKRNDFTLAW